MAAGSAFRHTRMLFRLLALGMGAAHTLAAGLRQSMNEDGISYLDMGDAYLRGDWAMAVNAVWSPLYSWILGLAMRLANPSPRWEFPLVHVVNFGIYLLALFCFEFFWRRLGVAAGVGDERREVGFPEWAWLAMGYSLFLWSSLCLIEIWAVTPDMLVAALVYVAAGILVRIGAGGAPMSVHAVYGMVLGLAYLAKAVMFPLGFAFLAAAALVRKGPRETFRGPVLALGVFLAVSLPLVVALSATKGRLTFGDAGRLTYLRYVNGVPYPVWPAGFEFDGGRPDHPARLVLDDPPVYEFAAPVEGTYPLSYDPSYWYEGVTARLDIGRQARVVLANSLRYFELFIRQQAGIVAVVAALFLVKGTRRRELGSRQLRIRPDARSALTAVGVAALMLYVLVYVEGRYVAPFVVLFWAGILAHFRLPEATGSRRLLGVSAGVLAFFWLVNVGAFNLAFSRAFLGVEVTPPETPARWSAEPAGAHGLPSEVAEDLRRQGIGRGDRIGFVGYAFGAYFARLGRMQIVAQIPPQDAAGFWDAAPDRRWAVLKAFSQAGAKAIVTDRVPAGDPPEGWVRVGESGYWVRRLGTSSIPDLRDEVFQGSLEERLGDPAMSGRVPVSVERDVIRSDRPLRIAVVEEEGEEVDERDRPGPGPRTPELDLRGIPEAAEDVVGPWIDRYGHRDLMTVREVEQPVHMLGGPF